MVRKMSLMAGMVFLICRAASRPFKSGMAISSMITSGSSSAAAELRPDVIVLDIAMPLLNGLDAARQLKKTMPKIKLIFLTMNEDPNVASEAFRAGASGYLLKTSASSELSKAIKEALCGRSYVTPIITQGMVDSLIRRPADDGSAPQLTPRQREVLQLLAEGHSMKEAAKILSVTPRTVAFHKYRMMEQLNLKNNSDLIQYALRECIVPVKPGY
jgi:DNA-binding NarL/FixJ family response regulator